MAGLKITIDDRQARRDLARIERRLGNLRPVMRDIGELAVNSVRTNFEVGGRPDKWRPLKSATLRGQYTAGNADRKRRRVVRTKAGKISSGFARFATGKKILIGSGRLMRSITSRAGARRVEVGTNVKYAAIHHFGGRAGRNRSAEIPARPYMLLQTTDVQEIQAILARFALEK